MTKINHEEYEILKELDDKWKWIARDTSRNRHRSKLSKYKEKPEKTPYQWLAFNYEDMDDSKFKFIKWEDEEPYNIAELVEEYEDSKEYKDSLVIEYFMDKAEKSEETEVKKDIEWVKEEISDIAHKIEDELYTEDTDFRMTTRLSGMIDVLQEIKKVINQLDEPEVLSDKWIEDNSVYASSDGITDEYVHVDELQNLLVPKQELPVIPKFVAEHIENRKGETLAQAYNIPTLTKVGKWLLDKKNCETFARAWLDGYEVEEEQKYVVKIPTNENNDIPYAIVADSGDIWTDALPSKYKLTEEEIRGLTKGDVLFEHFAVKVEEMEK